MYWKDFKYYNTSNDCYKNPRNIFKNFNKLINGLTMKSKTAVIYQKMRTNRKYIL